MFDTGVGGAAQGSMSGGMREIWQEGLRIPVMRLIDRGNVNREVMDLLLLNMRLPEERRGDLNAQIAACHLGVDRMKSLIARYGEATVSVGQGEDFAILIGMDASAFDWRAGII